MALIHILENSDPGGCRCVLHAAVPDGQNAAGYAWKDLLLATGQIGTSCLTKGIGPGQITANELAQIEQGKLIELLTVVRYESTGGDPAGLRKLALKALTQHLDLLKARFKYYGAIQEK